MMSWDKLGVYAGMFIGSLYFLFLLVYQKRISRKHWLLNIEIALFVLSISIANYMSLRDIQGQLSLELCLGHG